MWVGLMQLLDKLGGTPASRFQMGLRAMEAEDLALRMGKEH